MDKKNMIHKYSHSAIKKKNKFQSILVRWMDLEPDIQSEVSQKEQNK